MLENDGGIVLLGAVQATAVEAIGRVGIGNTIAAIGMVGCQTESVGVGLHSGSVVRIAAVESAV